MLAAVVVYANSLNGPFILDDQNSIIDNSAIRELSAFGGVLQQRDTPIAGRPVVALSFAIDYAIGGLTVTPFHRTNLAIHLLCALLIFGIGRRTLVSRPNIAADAANLAFATALIWVVHPLNTEAVDYLTERTESLMALFMLLTLYASIRSAASANAGRWDAAAVLACCLGMGCKESMAVTPVLLALYDRVFLFPSLASALTFRWRLYAGLAGSWLVLGYLMLPGPRSSTVGFSAVSPVQYLLSQTRMVARYFRLALWPSDLVVNYGPVVPVALVDVVPQAILIAMLLTMSVIALVRWPPVGFLGAWTFITLAPASSIIPIATQVGAERRMYVPLIALVSLAVLAGHTAVKVLRLPRIAAVAILGGLVIGLGATTAVRNREYSDPLVLAESTLRRWPTAVAHGMVGGELMALHRDEEAIAELRLGAPADVRARYNLGAALFNTGHFDEAIHEFMSLAEAHPKREEAPWARRLAGRAYAVQGRWPEAVEQLSLALTMVPGDGETRQLLVDALNNQGTMLARAGRFDDAAAALRRAISIDGSRADVRHMLAAVLVDANDPVGAEAEARQAIAIGPQAAATFDVLGRALALQGKLDEAIATFERALRLAPGDQQIEDDLRRVVASRRTGTLRPSP